MYHRITIVMKSRHGWMRLWRRRELSWAVGSHTLLEELQTVQARYGHQIHRIQCQPLEDPE